MFGWTEDPISDRQFRDIHVTKGRSEPKEATKGDMPSNIMS